LPSVAAGPQLSAPTVEQEMPSAEEPATAPSTFPLAGRGAEVEAAAANANAILQQGFRLAERRAWYSARAEFFKGLWIVARALDGPATDHHAAALGTAVKALDEAEDFMPRTGQAYAEIDLPLVISSHRTPVLKGETKTVANPRMALDRYLVFAQQKLAAAVDGQPVGSKALYLLGRLHTVVAQDRSPCFAAAEQKALAFQQAAMSADPDNFMAANELGVLLARAGRYEEARTILQHCASLAPKAEVWHNLVVVHRNLGEIALAQQAQQRLAAAQSQRQTPAPVGQSRPSDMVEWVEPEEFARTGAAPAAVIAPRPAAATTPAAAPQETTDEPRPAGPLGWLSRPARQAK
jgi:tetratricopeptide (TPR) repeat protein